MNFTLAFDNWLEAATITSSTEDTLYPLANLTDRRPSKAFRFTVTSASWIHIDLLSSLNPELISLVNHNFTVDATVLVKHSDNDSDWTTEHTFTAAELAAKTLFYFINGSAHRYWKVEGTDATNPEMMEIGELFLGAVETMARNYNWGRGWEPRDNKKEMITDGGCIWDSQWSENDAYTLTFEYLEAADMAILKDTTERGHKHGLIFLDAITPIYGKITDLKNTELPGLRLNVSIGVLADSFGVVL
jgi:hypothetical protein